MTWLFIGNVVCFVVLLSVIVGMVRMLIEYSKEKDS